MSKTPPGPRGYPLVGVLPSIWRDPLAFFQQVAREHGDVARVGIGKFTLYLLSAPEPIQYVLVDNARNFWKGAGLAAAEPVMGQGLATSDGEFWKRQRRLCQPSFGRARVQALVPPMNQAIDELLDRWAEAARAERVIDVMEEMSGLVQSLIFRCLFGGQDQLDTRALGRALVEANAWINHAAWSFLPIPDAVPTPRKRRFKRAMRLLDETVYGLIATRRAAGAAGDDLLSRLLAATDDAGEGMSDKAVRDEVMTLFVAGHDTTAAAIAWTLYLLSQHPTAWERVETETLEQFHGRIPTGAGLAELEYLPRVIQESMRLYPPAWVIVRTPREDDVVGGYPIPKDAPLLISPYVVHRSPAVWEEPTEFDPSRFLPERTQARPRFAYLPYGGGARLCIGKEFADQAIRLVLTRVAQRFRLELVPGQTIVPRPLTTLRPKRGIRMRLKVG